MSSKDLSFPEPLVKDNLVIYDEKRDIAKPNASSFYFKKKACNPMQLHHEHLWDHQSNLVMHSMGKLLTVTG